MITEEHWSKKLKIVIELLKLGLNETLEYDSINENYVFEVVEDILYLKFVNNEEKHYWIVADLMVGYESSMSMTGSWCGQ